MTREQLRLRYIAAVNRHWRSSLDKSGPTPELLDDLVTIAEDHAVAHAGKVTARQQLRAEAAAAPPVAASPDDPPPVMPVSPGPLPGPSHRTRARARRTAD